MNSIIEDLYFGRIYPHEQFQPILHHYRQKRDEAFEGFEALMEQLNGEQKADLEAVMDRYYALLPLEMAQNFSDGFRLGVRLMCEALRQEDVEAFLGKLEAGGGIYRTGRH